MKRAICISLVLSAMVAVPLAAQAVYVPESSYTGSCNVIPMGGAWPSSNTTGEWTYQTHLKASAIGRSGLVVGLAFLSCNNQTLTATLGRIRMSHTTLTSPSSTFATNMPCAVEVFPAGPFAWVGQAQSWSPLPMTRGFYYDGARNLTVEIRFQGASVTGSSGSCDTNSSHANAPLRTYAYGAGAYTATTAQATGSTAGLKVRLLFADQAYGPSNTPTAGTCNTYPMGWGSEGRFQMVVDAQYLPPVPTKITDLAFAPCATTNFVAKQFQVRMTHTTLTTFASSLNFDPNLGACPIVVYDGPMSWNAVQDTWSDFNLKCAFGYDGKRNLLIEIRYMGGANGTSVHRDTVNPRLFASGSGTYSATTGSTDSGTTKAGPKVRLTLDGRCYLTVGDTMSIGGKNAVSLMNFPVGGYYQIAASFGQMPLTFGKYTICLAPDNLFFTSLLVGPPVFNNYGGTTSICGTGQGILLIPSIPGLRGVCVYHAAIAYTRSGIVGATNTGGSALR
jgi:hypothetical protein